MVNDNALTRGFTLLEVTIWGIIIGISLSGIIGSYTNRMNKARYQATVREMGSIAQAVLDYYRSENSPSSWPGSLSDLVPKYMPHVVTSSPFKGAYQFTCSNSSVSVTTMVPKGLLKDPTEGGFLTIISGTTQDQVSITLNLTNDLDARLSYEKKYLYKQWSGF